MKNGNWGQALTKAMLHEISRSAITKLQGGRWSSGFWSGFASSFFSPGTKLGGEEGAEGITLRTVIAGTIGGTVSEITGGKFANGAVTGAFVHLFNAEGKTFMESIRELGTKLSDGTITGDIKQGLKGGLNGYREVRDNAPLGIRIWLKTTMTITEMGATARLSGWKAIGYDLVSGAYFDTFQTTKASLLGFFGKVYINESMSTDGLPVKASDLNPYEF